ncbi:hypothetical protein Tco_0053613 [Tanacetum coccineum]
MAAAVARGHGSPSAGDPPPPSRAQRGRGRGGRNGGRDGDRKGVLKATRNIELKKYADVELGIEAYFAKHYSDNKYNLKQDYWNVKAGETRDVDVIRRRPPLNVEPSNWEV